MGCLAGTRTEVARPQRPDVNRCRLPRHDLSQRSVAITLPIEVSEAEMTEAVVRERKTRIVSGVGRASRRAPPPPSGSDADREALLARIEDVLAAVAEFRRSLR